MSDTKNRRTSPFQPRPPEPPGPGPMLAILDMALAALRDIVAGSSDPATQLERAKYHLRRLRQLLSEFGALTYPDDFPEACKAVQASLEKPGDAKRAVKRLEAAKAALVEHHEKLKAEEAKAAEAQAAEAQSNES